VLAMGEGYYWLESINRLWKLPSLGTSLTMASYHA